MSEPVVTLEDVAKRFERPRRLRDLLTRKTPAPVRAVDGVTLTVDRGEVLALVGESGCGKTTTANLVLGLLTPDGGRVVVAGEDLSTLSATELRRKRRQLQMVFQDPYESLNPRMTVRQIVAEPLRVHGLKERGRVVEAVEEAGLRPAEAFLDRRPHELSGGQRQRVVIASALALEPEVIIADEPVSMLDVSVRAEVLNLLTSLARERSISIVMITHDLSTVAAYSDRLAVMYLGRIVEIGPTAEIVRAPAHPYTRALLSVVPVPRPQTGRQRIILSGETPDPARIPSGCRFHPRCPEAFDLCPEVDPPLYDASEGHGAACLLLRQS